MKIEKVGELAFDVISDSGRQYFVAFVDQWVCSCPDFTYRQPEESKPHVCKHIRQVKVLVASSRAQ